MIINKLTTIENEIKSKIDEFKLSGLNPKIIAVSKTFPMKDILPLINYGHLHFGENKVQEAIEKWSDVKISNKLLKLHMIGKLQSNKVKYAVDLFDYIHSLDNLKLAETISKEQIKKGKNLKLFIQVNLGKEDQKSGIYPEKIQEFLNVCVNDLKLNIIGLMCIPPNEINTENFFLQMKRLNEQVGLNELSMGMSNDYIEAIKHEASFVRIGSKIFGKRD
jgi:PLP dependent protein